MTKKWLLIDYNNEIETMLFDCQDDLLNYFNFYILKCEDYTDAMTYKELFNDDKYFGVKIIEIQVEEKEDFNQINLKTSKQLINK